MKEIYLTKGKTALVDDWNYTQLNAHNWYTHSGRYTCYACRRIGGRKDSVIVRMHRILVNATADMVVDHLDGNGLNNQVANLRLCTNSQNMQHRINHGGYQGVNWSNKEQKFTCYITVNYKSIALGRFTSAEEAALVYNEAALKYFGEFACFNQIKGGDQTIISGKKKKETKQQNTTK